MTNYISILDKLNQLFDKYADLTEGMFHNSLWQIMINGDENGWSKRKGQAAFIHIFVPKKGRYNVGVAQLDQTGYTPVTFGIKAGVPDSQVEAFLGELNSEIFGITPEFAEEIEFKSYR